MNAKTILILIILAPNIFLNLKKGEVWRGSPVINPSINLDKPEKCSCHCRIGYYKGESVKKYNNPVINIGVLKKWGGIVGATRSRLTTCKKLCQDRMPVALHSIPKQEFCKKSERFLQGQNRIPMNRLVAYFKVGGRKWQRCDARFEKCE